VLLSTELRKLIREEAKKMLKEAQAPKFKAKHANNNLVAAIYFSWNKSDNNNQSLWDKVIQIIEQEGCRLVNYVVTDSVCEFEFRPSIGVQSQDQLDDARYRVIDAIKPLSGQFTGYDVYIVGS
jgi:hypothetical protein